MLPFNTRIMSCRSLASPNSEMKPGKIEGIHYHDRGTQKFCKMIPLVRLDFPVGSGKGQLPCWAIILNKPCLNLRLQHIHAGLFPIPSDRLCCENIALRCLSSRPSCNPLLGRPFTALLSTVSW